MIKYIPNSLPICSPLTSVPPNLYPLLKNRKLLSLSLSLSLSHTHTHTTATTDAVPPPCDALIPLGLALRLSDISPFHSLLCLSLSRLGLHHRRLHGTTPKPGLQNTHETAHAIRKLPLGKAKRYLEDVLVHKQVMKNSCARKW
ncbi:hypothetical protein I3842_03G225700 [Carya illinoinensis]|uniref:Uncharacterized protein n=1 Tax=Carya illinoinensis TaxID=32201 RepID=A0A922FJZ1_CARIL|nr:hypothetical protein I3842_03G225700 [Carya illinoinensis]